MSYDYRIPQGRDKGKRTNGMFSLGGKLGSVLSALGNGEKLMQVRLWQNWEMVMGPDIAPLAWPLGARNDILIVGGEDNLALQELSFMTPEILERVNAFMDAPVFDRVELRLVMGDRPLDQMPDIQPSTRVRPAPPRPRASARTSRCRGPAYGCSPPGICSGSGPHPPRPAPGSA